MPVKLGIKKKFDNTLSRDNYMIAMLFNHFEMFDVFSIIRNKKMIAMIQKNFGFVIARLTFNDDSQSLNDTLQREK